MKHLYLLFLLFFLKVSAQSEIKGLLMSETNHPLYRANIILADKEDNTLAFVFTNKDGSFLLKTDKFGDMQVQITAVGYQNKKFPIRIIRKNTEIDLKTIVVDHKREKEIKEVVIKRSSPIRIKKDTIEYTTKNFSTGTEQNVEDILKKLPGIKVMSDGKIKVGDKEVERVMVENDDLFEKGYQTLTQNMPSKPVEKVQVLKNYSKNKLLKDIENSDRIAINLVLKEDAKGKWFGNLILTSTSFEENMRQGKINIMNFSKRKKVYFLLNANNLGLNEMKGVEYLISPNTENEAENVGTDLQTLSIVNLHRKNFSFEDNRTNFNNDRLASINYIYNFKTDWKLKFVTIFNEIENNNFVSSSYKFNFNGQSFNNFEDKSWKQNNQNIVGKLELSKELNKISNIQFYNKVSFLKEENDNLFIFNQNPNQQLGNNRLFASENRLIYTRKVDSSKAWVGVARYIFQNRPYDFTDENDSFVHLLNLPDAQKIRQTIQSKMNFAGAKISYMKKYSDENSLDIQFGNEYRNDVLNSRLSLFNFNNLEVHFDDKDYINHNNFSKNNLFAQAKYSYKSKQWNYDFTVLNQLISTNINGSENTGYHLSPSASLGYRNRKVGSFNLMASRSFQSVSINDLYTNFIYRGNRDIQRSTIDRVVLPNFNLGFSYNLGDQLSQYLSWDIHYIKNENSISHNMIVDQSYVINQSILVKNNYNVSSNLELMKYLKFIKSRFSLLGSYNKSIYQNSVNNQPLLQSQFETVKLGFEMKSGWVKKINYELGFDWIFSSLVSDANSNSYIDQKGYFNLYYNFSPLFRLESKLEYYKNGNTDQKVIQFWDVKLNYNWKKHNMTLFLLANNILNASSIQRFSITNISESRYTQKLLPRHFVLGINVNF